MSVCYSVIILYINTVFFIMSNKYNTNLNNI